MTISPTMKRAKGIKMESECMGERSLTPKRERVIRLQVVLHEVWQ